MLGPVMRLLFNLRLATAFVRRWVKTFVGIVTLMWPSAPFSTTVEARQPEEILTAGDTALLEETQRRAVLFFLEHSDPVTGLTRDRAPKDGAPGSSPASMAATGFALTAWCIADAHGWIPDGDALL